MARLPQDITDAELAVLQVLWKHAAQQHAADAVHGLSIRQITDELYPDGRTSQYATVQKLLERLENKECVERDRSEFVHVFRAKVGRDELVGRRLQAVAEQLCEGSITPLLTHLVQGKKLSNSDRQMLRDLIDAPDATSRKKRSK